jgi:hypothetical protein
MELKFDKDYKAVPIDFTQCRKEILEFDKKLSEIYEKVKKDLPYHLFNDLNSLSSEYCDLANAVENGMKEGREKEELKKILYLESETDKNKRRIMWDLLGILRTHLIT